MFFVLSKILQLLVYPLPLLFLILFGIAVWYHRKRARAVLLIVMVCLYGLSIPYTADHLMQWLEVPRVSGEALQPRYDAVIVLSGMLHVSLSREGRLEFNGAVERILAGVTFIRKGIGDRLIISGGSGNLFDQRVSEARLLKDFAMQLGLTAEQILIEATSRNTYENALHSARLLRAHHYQRALLITSAFHVRRAAAAFHKQGIFPDTYPVDFRSGAPITPFSFVPSAECLHKTTSVIRELVGLIVYRIQGYI